MEKYLNFKDKIDYNKLDEVAKIIRNGGVTIFPTETVYGIGANGLDENAIKKLYEIKQRPFNKTISLLVSNINMIQMVTKDVTDVEYALIKEFFPGPLTLILKKKNIVPDILTSNTDTIGIRMPSNKIALELIDKVGLPVATSSSNISGKTSKTSLDNIEEYFKERIDCFIDDGQSKIGVSSTVVKVVDNIPHILRTGPISKGEIDNVCKRYL